LDEWWQNRRSSLATQEPEPPQEVEHNTSGIGFRAVLSQKSAILVGTVILGAVVVYFTMPHTKNGSPEMRQLTRIGGVRPLGCSLSNDGKTIVFASDAAEEGNIDIWVQETGGTEARRLTHGSEADFDPSISPDGAKILFVSRRASGSGIYQIATAGGQEKLLIPEGEGPRYSPDGQWIAYLSGNEPRHLYVSDSAGVNIREIATGLARFDHPIWSPDGKYLMLNGQRARGQPTDWWVVPIAGQESINTSVLHDLAPYFSSSLRRFVYAQAWLPDGRILFAADQDGIWSIWRIRLSTGNFRLIGTPERIIRGQTPMDVRFAVAGDRLAFVNALPGSQLWKLPVDTGLGQMTGNPRRVTREGSSQFPSLSADGKVLAYASSSATVGNGLAIYARNVDTGEEAAVVSSPERKGYTTLSRDGSKIAYGLVVPGQKRPIYIYDRSTRTTRKLCDDCEGRPYDWSPDGTKLILSMPQKGIGLMDVNTGERSVILPGAFAVFSPDGRWLAVAAAAVERGGGVFIVPFRGREEVPKSEWVPVGDAASGALFPSWSPGGELLYFFSSFYSNPSSFILAAQRFHPDSGQLEGRPFYRLPV
jgi:Tol biopolymer transport system component